MLLEKPKNLLELSVKDTPKSIVSKSVSKSIVYVIKHTNFKFHRVHPDGVI